MSAPTADEVADLRRRVREESGLGQPVPNVSPEIARLLVDLLVALERAVLPQGVST